MYSVKTEKFEGPLELLLKLIEERKFSINEISLAEVTEQYLFYFNSSQNFSFLEAAEFLTVAATLILIKSKSLLPELALSKEEETSIEELQGRLELYKIFKEAAKIIENNYQKNILWAREKFLNIEPLFMPSPNLTLENIRKALEEIINALPEKEILPEKTVQQKISLEDVISRIRSRLEQAGKLNFASLAESQEKINIILNFLAVLELIKQGAILAVQTSQEEVMIERI